MFCQESAVTPPHHLLLLQEIVRLDHNTNGLCQAGGLHWSVEPLEPLISSLGCLLVLYLSCFCSFTTTKSPHCCSLSHLTCWFCCHPSRARLAEWFDMPILQLQASFHIWSQLWTPPIAKFFSCDPSLVSDPVSWLCFASKFHCNNFQSDMTTVFLQENCINTLDATAITSIPTTVMSSITLCTAINQPIKIINISIPFPLQDSNPLHHTDLAILSDDCNGNGDSVFSFRGRMRQLKENEAWHHHVSESNKWHVHRMANFVCCLENWRPGLPISARCVGAYKEACPHGNCVLLKKPELLFGIGANQSWSLFLNPVALVGSFSHNVQLLVYFEVQLNIVEKCRQIQILHFTIETFLNHSSKVSKWCIKWQISLHNVLMF